MTCPALWSYPRVRPARFAELPGVLLPPRGLQLRGHPPELPHQFGVFTVAGLVRGDTVARLAAARFPWPVSRVSAHRPVTYQLFRVSAARYSGSARSARSRALSLARLRSASFIEPCMVVAVFHFGTECDVPFARSRACSSWRRWIPSVVTVSRVRRRPGVSDEGEGVDAATAGQRRRTFSVPACNVR